MRAVLDTSVLYDDLPMTGLRSRTILDQCARGRLDASVPEVVVLEMVNHARERIIGALSRIGNGAERLGRLNLSPGAPPRAAGVLVREFDRELRRRLADHNVDVPDIPAVEHRALVNRSIAGSKPFRASGKGYRDALIWHNVLEAAGAGDVLLVTGNTADFADVSKAALHPDLRTDLIRIHRPDAVRLYTTLGDFISEHVPSSDQALQQALLLLESDPAFAHDFRAKAAEALADVGAWPSHTDVTIVELEGESMRGEETPQSTDVDDLTLLGELQLVRALELGEENLFVLEFEASAEVRFNLIFDPAAAEWLVDRGSNVEFYDQSESYWAGYSTGYLIGRLSASFDQDDKSVGDVELTELRDLPPDDERHPW